MTVFLFFLFYSVDQYFSFLIINRFVELVIYLLAIITIVLTVVRLNKWLKTLRYRFRIEVIASILLILFFAHEFFAPYFYPENYLKEVGIEKIEMYHQLASPDLSAKELEKLAEGAVVKEMVAHYIITESYPNIGSLENIEVLDFKRNYSQYELLIQAEQPEGEKTYQYTFAKEGFDFKIIGFAQLD
ncbi:TusA-related sulfurtransferase [Bacillus tianshenii]|uniref:TusA-related sulfurtransferase n=1 Tax=Sutcliffiella tianshenii TaxID=1463404 RepID=A0ABS2P4R7_9BACI|nr:TusA-related sulfurtransferase [Bacillus tianshenii]